MKHGTRHVAVATVLIITLLPPHGRAQDVVSVSLNRIHREYVALGNRPDVGRLVLLDQELRRLLPYQSWEGSPVEDSTIRFEYEQLGVKPMLFAGEFLAYSGKLLHEAHAHDPKAYRSYTLYSTVFGAGGEHGFSSVPSPGAAEAYLREFPTGPFVVDARVALAGFYADLFKVVRWEEDGEPRNYKYDCFKAYIDATPLAAQRRRAQELAVMHYAALTQLLPSVTHLAHELTELRAGRSSGWHFCAD